MPWRAPAATVFALALVFACGIARAAGTPPLVFAVDLTLEGEAREKVGAAINTVVDAFTVEGEVGLIVFDEVVVRSVPLAPPTREQRVAIDGALALTARAVDGDISVGIDRALDELDDRRGAHLFVFALARFLGEDATTRADSIDWFRETFLPDADANGIALTLVAPSEDVDATLREELERYRANAFYTLGAPAAGAVGGATEQGLADLLLGRVRDDQPLPTTVREREPEIAGAERERGLPWGPVGGAVLLTLMLIGAAWIVRGRVRGAAEVGGAPQERETIVARARTTLGPFMPSAWRSYPGNTERGLRSSAYPAADLASFDDPTLIVNIDDSCAPLLLTLDEQSTEWLVGSDSACDLIIAHPSVSAKHAKLWREGRRWRLSDLFATNDTYIDGRKINVGFLSDGCTLRFGAVGCRFVLPKREDLPGRHRPPT